VSKLDYAPYDVLVADNAPSDDRAREVAARWGANYIMEPVAGVSRSRNRAARLCRSEVVAYLDDDAVPEPGWLSAVAREFGDPLVMAVSGRICALRVDTEAERLFAALGGFDQGEQRRVVDQGTPDWFELANFGGLGDGNMAFRRRAFDCWPGFHLSLGRGAILVLSEEHHAFFSLIARGYRVVYTPEAVIRHPYPQTIEQIQARHLTHAISATAYLTLMLAEQPGYRWATLKYALGALFGKSRQWRYQSSTSSRRLVSPWRTALAWLAGPLWYAKSRFGKDVRQDVPATVPAEAAPSIPDNALVG
jgi:cellulose synthase/poly-beta-1,6-N-acetylglucosamine synthase-like glycosyltransferase